MDYIKKKEFGLDVNTHGNASSANDILKKKTNLILFRTSKTSCLNCEKKYIQINNR